MPEPGAHVPVDKRIELTQRMETLFRVGGLMTTEFVQMCSKGITLLRPTAINATGNIWCWYSYYEQAFWEEAVFARTKGVLQKNL